MTEYLKGRAEVKVGDLIDEKASVLSDAVHQLRMGKTDKFKSLNATLDEMESDLSKRGLTDEQKTKFYKGFAQSVMERGIPLAAELAKEDFDRIDTNGNKQMQKCELDTFVAKERTKSDSIKNIALDSLQREAGNFAPGRDKCACDYPMAFKADLDTYEKRQEARILENPYFNALCNDEKVFDKLSHQTYSLDHDQVQADANKCKDSYCNIITQLDELGEKQDQAMKQGNCSDDKLREFEQRKDACQVRANDLKIKRAAEIFLLENWDKIQDTTGGINQTALANYAKKLAAEAANAKPIPVPSTEATGRR